jgi:hypothetical protein
MSGPPPPARAADLESADRRLRKLAEAAGAEEVPAPALIPRATLERAGYPEAFPHLLFAVAAVADPAAEEGLLEPGNLASPGWCLSPAACYHVYPRLAGESVHRPRVFTVRGRCFRNEAGEVPGVRLREFEMREVVVLGPGEVEVERLLAGLARRLTSLAARAGITGGWEPAEDPFFLPRSAAKALMQQLLETKQELRVGAGERYALASVNHHGTHLCERFGITAPGGGPAASGCLAIGLERWVTAAREAEERR